MSKFQREERYIVVKLKHLAGLQHAPLKNFLRENHVPSIDCVVVESDWPEYEPVWQMIERRMTGQPSVTAAEELDAVLHWRNKHAQAINERDALQLRLNAADQRIDDLETELKVTKQSLNSLKGERDDLPISKQQCQFPQSCTTRCDCIPDFSPGNGNKARRRAQAIEALKPENQRVVPIQPDDPLSTCLGCFGTGTICKIEEASPTTCNECNGTGRENL